MTQWLPSNLLMLFKPNDPIEFKEPLDPLPHARKYHTCMSGVAQYVNLFEDPKDTPPPTKVETKEERLERKKKEREERSKTKLEARLAEWDPKARESITEDPFKTLFVARMNYETTEDTLRREFEEFGPIKKIYMVTDVETGKPRGYAFLEFEHESDMHAAYKRADGRKIDGRRVVVDVERARTVDEWKPRSLGGGLGGTRKGAPSECIRYSGRVSSSTGGTSGSGGGSSSRYESSYRSSGGSYRDRGSSRYDDRYDERSRDDRSSSSYRSSRRYDDDRRDDRKSRDRDRDHDREREHDRDRRSSRDDRRRDDRDDDRRRDRDRY
eukprot:m.484814 g.484814  ORF g.484814 m.484814 type:complete len:325 (-) comp23555_c0_seq1:187-1161(-)